MTALQAMYVVSLIVAGGAGVIVLFFPEVAVRYVFMNEDADDHITRILGAVLLAMGIVAAFGIAEPEKFSPLLLLQLVYMVAWLLLDAIPAFLAGQRSRAQTIYSGVFALWSAALAVTLPRGHLFG